MWYKWEWGESYSYVLWYINVHRVFLCKYLLVHEHWTWTGESLSMKWCTIKWKSFEYKLGHSYTKKKKNIYFPRYYEVVHYGNLLDDTGNHKDENELKKIFVCNSYQENVLFVIFFFFLSSRAFAYEMENCHLSYIPK